MSEIYMTLCDSCAEKMDADRHPENKYYLIEMLESRRPTKCTKCFQTTTCAQYAAKSKAMVAFEREMARQKKNRLPGKDTRAHYHGPWRTDEKNEE